MSPVRQYKATTNARRGASTVDTKDLAKGPRKSLVRGRKYTAGRTRSGITARHRGGGAKRLLREVDFVQTKAVPAKVESIEYDPNRTAFIALLKYADGDRRYVLAEQTMRVGQEIRVGADVPIKKGNRLPLGKIPGGTAIYNIQLSPEGKGTLVRSAGSSATVAAHESKTLTQVKLPSGEVRRIPAGCLATLGSASNRDHENVTIGKAGRVRRKGRRPHVRGKAMNPVDHPHGGGEGGSPIGLPGPKTPSGLYTLGRKTRKRPRSKSVVRPRKGR